MLLITKYSINALNHNLAQYLSFPEISGLLALWLISAGPHWLALHDTPCGTTEFSWKPAKLAASVPSAMPQRLGFERDTSDRKNINKNNKPTHGLYIIVDTHSIINKH